MKARIGYLVSKYPAVSHTFILREVLFLKAQGLDLKTFSINVPDQLKEWTGESEEYQEAAQTITLKSLSFHTLIKESIFSCIRHPLQSIKALGYSLWLSGGSPRKVVRHLFYWGEALVVANWLGANKIEHLHVHFANPAAIVALLATQIQGGTYSLTVHGPDELENSETGLLPLKLQAARQIFCISYYAQAQVWRYLKPEEWPKTKVCYLGVDTEVYRPERNKALGSRIISVGRLTAVKGQRFLLEVCRQLREEGYFLEVVLVGDGPERQSLERWIQEHAAWWVSLKGSLSQEETLQEYRRADLFVLPTFAEGLPVALMEAMSMELPCLVSCVNGIPELICNGSNGVLVPASDWVALREGIGELLQDPEKRRRLGQAGRRTVEEKFSLEMNTRLFAEALIKMIDSHPKTPS